MRKDGRNEEDLREVEMKLDVVERASGSANVKFGNTEAIAAVYGPKALFPRFLQESTTGTLRCRYNMAPFSVDDRKAPGHDRRSIELSKVIRLALEPAIFLEEYPRAGIFVFIEMIQADGSTRVTGINALSMALAAAGIPMKDLVTACSVGKADDTLIVDLDGDEDCNGQADVAIAMMPSKNLITLLQMDGILSKEEFLTLLNMAKKSCEKIYEMQKRTLKERYKEGEE
jgi:exosome complex component RRP41